MAYSIEDAARAVEKLLDASHVGIDGSERLSLAAQGEAYIGGFRCKVANVLTLSSARVLVNTSWFNFQRPDYAKPRMQRGSGNVGVDFQLLPSMHKLFAVHYLELRQFALGLEQEREHWFSQSYWGVQIDEKAHTFTWTGGNTRKFPLLELTSSTALKSRASDLFTQMQRA